MSPHGQVQGRAGFTPDEKALANFCFALFLVPLASCKGLWLNSNDNKMLLITLICTLGKHSSPSPRPCTYVLFMSLPLRIVLTMLAAPSCVLGAVSAPLEPLALWLKFPLMLGNFFFLVSLEMTLSVNHSCLQPWGWGWGWEDIPWWGAGRGWGQIGFPRESCALHRPAWLCGEAGGLQEPLGWALGQKIGWSLDNRELFLP